MTGIHQAVSANPGGKENLFQTISRLGLTTSLNVCLDAGASESTNGTSQTWTDLSGSGNNYFRGTTSGVDATDPTFNGTAGNLSSSEFFSNDGGDKFAPTATQSFSDNWHKSGGAWTVMAVLRPNGGVTPAIWTNTNGPSASSPGLTVLLYSLTGPPHVLRYFVSNTNTTKVSAVSSVNITDTAVNFVLVGRSDATQLVMNVNGTVDVSVPGASTATNAPSGPMFIWENGAGSDIPPLGSRLFCLALWSRQLSSAESTLLYENLKPRFGYA